MSRKFLILGGWLRVERSYRKLIISAPNDCSFIFLHHRKALDVSGIENHISGAGISKINIIGHSTGGALAVEFASRYPKLVEHLYLVDSEGVYGGEKTVKMFASLLYNNVHHGHKKLSATFYSTLYLIRSPFLSLKSAKYAHFVDLKSDLMKIKVPTTILWGEKDAVTPLWQGKEMRTLVKNSKLKVLRGMDHDWILHNPEKFWEKIVGV